MPLVHLELIGLLVVEEVVNILGTLQVVLEDLVEDRVDLMLQQVQVEHIQLIPVWMHSQTMVVGEVAEKVPVPGVMVGQVRAFLSSLPILAK